MLRVIGAGFGRTGTYSLKTALEQLGFGPSYHMAEVFEHPEDVAVWQAAANGEPVDWDALFAGYAAAVDWPASAFYRPLAERYPDAKVILTVRDPERWYESGKNTIFPPEAGYGEDELSPERLAHTTMTRAVLWDGIFGGQVYERDHALRVFEQHIAEVQSSIPSDRLLTFDVAEGWEPLCAFLGVPVPSEPFPRLNDTASFNERRNSGANSQSGR